MPHVEASEQPPQTATAKVQVCTARTLTVLRAYSAYAFLRPRSASYEILQLLDWPAERCTGLSKA